MNNPNLFQSSEIDDNYNMNKGVWVQNPFYQYPNNMNNYSESADSPLFSRGSTTLLFTPKKRVMLVSAG